MHESLSLDPVSHRRNAGRDAGILQGQPEDSVKAERNQDFRAAAGAAINPARPSPPAIAGDRRNVGESILREAIRGAVQVRLR